MQQSRTAQCLIFLAMERIGWLSCTGEGNYRGCKLRTISKEFQNPPLRLAKPGGLHRLDGGVEEGGVHGLGVGKGNGQGVGGVGFRQLGQGESRLHHFGDSLLLCCAVANDGLLDLARRDFEHVQLGPGQGGQCRSSRLAHYEGGSDVLRVEKAFDSGDGRFGFLQNVLERFRNLAHAPGERPVGGAADGALAEGGRDGLGGVDDAVAGATERGIDAEDDLRAAAGWLG